MFEKNKILTAVTADQAKVGSFGWFGSLPLEIEERVEEEEPSVLKDVCTDGSAEKPFGNGHVWYHLFYPQPAPLKPLNSILLEGTVDSKPKDGRFTLKSDDLLIDVLASPELIYRIAKGDVVRVVGRIFGTKVAIKASDIEKR